MATKKTPAKKTPVTTTPAKKTPAKKTPAKKTPAKKTPAKKTPVTTTPAKKTPAKKTPAKTTPAKTTPAKKTPAKTTPAKKTPVVSTSASTMKSPTKKSAAGTKTAGTSASTMKRPADTEAAVGAKTAAGRRRVEPDFRGFSDATIAFLRELEQNNDREWFGANKTRYEENLRRPFEALASDLEPELGAAKVFRIYNDVRFAKGKPPYKTHGSVVFEDGRRGLVYYVHLEKDHLFVATGMHAMLPDQVRRYLAAAADEEHGADLAERVARAESSGLEIGGEALKTVARGYPKDHPNARFLRHKGLTTARRLPIAPWLFSGEAIEHVREVFAEGDDVNRWLARHVGPSTEGNRWVKR
ncbi:MAG: TIGR02453 family protein [Myxococcales bacterium]|nr:TIGR02453 family protein [Myxococcales bacterium]